MASSMQSNGTIKQSRFDPNFTQNVINAIGPKTPDRTRFVLSTLIKHLHDFTREVELTTDEWMAGVQFMNAVGQISDAKRNEGQRISDVLGLESYALSQEYARSKLISCPGSSMKLRTS